MRETPSWRSLAVILAQISRDSGDSGVRTEEFTARKSMLRLKIKQVAGFMTVGNKSEQKP